MRGLYTGVILTQVEQGDRTVQNVVELKQRVENTGNDEKQPEYYKSICDALNTLTQVGGNS